MTVRQAPTVLVQDVSESRAGHCSASYCEYKTIAVLLIGSYELGFYGEESYVFIVPFED